MKVTATWTKFGPPNDWPVKFEGLDAVKKQLPEIDFDALIKNFFIKSMKVEFKYDGKVLIEFED